ncbi:MAG: type VI secretion system baseplate subunit TssG, partial [Solimonas sp.]
MAGGDRLAALRERFESYPLFAALRQVERRHPEMPRLGRSARAQDDAIRLGQTPALQFPQHDIHSITPPGDG